MDIYMQHFLNVRLNVHMDFMREPVSVAHAQNPLDCGLFCTFTDAQEKFICLR